MEKTPNRAITEEQQDMVHLATAIKCILNVLSRRLDKAVIIDGQKRKEDKE